MELFETYERLAFGDAAIAAHMEREGIKHLYSFDDDFDVLENVTQFKIAENLFT